MSLDGQSILSEYKSLVRGRAVAWDAYVRFNVVTETDIRAIKAADKVSAARRAQLLRDDPETYAQLILGDTGVVRKSANVDRIDLVQWMLMWTGDLLEDVPSFAESLLALQNPFELLLSLLEGSSDPVIPVLSSAILTPLLSLSLAGGNSNKKLSPAVVEALPKFYRYLGAVSKAQERDQQDLAIQAYVTLLRTPYAREAFWDMKEETMPPLVALLLETAGGTASERSDASGAGLIVQGGVPLQLVYHVLLVVWQLTFDETVAEEINDKYDIIPAITTILRSPIKEKITRVTLAILTNLVGKASGANLPVLLVTNILPYLQTLSARFNADSDPDLTADLAALVATLDAFQSSQTTLSSYRIEVMSAHLRWSPPHRNDAFWKRHARDIVDDAQLIAQLARVLATADDKTVLAVACNDVGVLVREVPAVRKKWVELGVKARVMALMADSDAEVRYEALKAVQGFLQTAFSG